MPTFKDYSQTGELLSVREEMLTASNKERYIKEFSEERYLGYLDSMKDMLDFFENKLTNPAGFKDRFYKYWNDREKFYKNATDKSLNNDSLSL